MARREHEIHPGSTQNNYDPITVRALFDEMSATYGVVNLVASFGFAARWRHQAVENLPFANGVHIVDLMSGMNELCHSISKYVTKNVCLTGVDFSPEMVSKARTDWPFVVENHLADIFKWDILSCSADVVVSSFGLKTFDGSQQHELARRVARLLRPGGIFSFVEISVPPARLLQRLYLFYLIHVIPWIGKLFLGNPDNYRMLGFYAREFGCCRHFATCLREQGLEVVELSYFFGCATGVRGFKPIVNSSD
ncbi:MAG TPA: class I SAM-dependent methyltransferase [Terriglobales bacterium]|nr:class I SAM-dependent methyltransferase [Terriglobales bacterium]